MPKWAQNQRQWWRYHSQCFYLMIPKFSLVTEQFVRMPHYVIRVLLHEWNVFPLKIQKSTVKKLHSHSVQKELGNAGEAQQSFQLLRWYAAQWNTGWNHLPRNLGKLYSDHSDGDEYINLPNFTSLVFVEEFGPLWVLALTQFVLTI